MVTIIVMKLSEEEDFAKTVNVHCEEAHTLLVLCTGEG